MQELQEGINGANWVARNWQYIAYPGLAVGLVASLHQLYRVMTGKESSIQRTGQARAELERTIEEVP